VTVQATRPRSAAADTRHAEAYAALDAVIDPELDEPVTDLGFVRSLTVEDDAVVLHLRLPTSFCSPNFAYLMASDAQEALAALPWAARVVVELDDHHDSAIINAGLAAGAGYRGTFKHEAQDSLDDLRETFRRKAHTAAAERCLTRLLRSDQDRTEDSVGAVTLGDLPADEYTAALRRRRGALGLPDRPDAPVLVDHEGRPPADVPLALRRARSTRISIDGNAHFCRGLLATRYGDVAHPEGDPGSPAFIPLDQLFGTDTRKELS
jgi:metal-sulfur cluster biosynthetic enzyme